jgi:hypothetical protein
MAREDGFFDELARGLADGSISRRRALGLFASSAIAALVPSTRALADDDHDGYTVCHVPGTPPNCDCTRARTIRGLSRRERNRHLRNHPCDSRGNCRNNPYCGTTTTTTSTTSTSTTSTSTSTTSTTPICLPEFAECTADTQCCSRICDGPSFPDLCQQCRFPGGSCTAGETCCDVNSISGPSFCVNGKCCAPEQRTCNANIQCCPGLMCVGTRCIS